MNDLSQHEGKPDLSEIKARLLQERMRGKKRSKKTPHSIERSFETELIPLSSYQKQIWFSDQFQDSHTQYARPLLLALEGKLDASRLQDAVNQLVARHEILRTTFPLVGAQPMQKIHPPNGCALELHDFSSHLQGMQDTLINQLFAERTKNYPIEIEPPFYPILIRRSENDHLLFLNMHHIINDAWSTQIIIEELFALYQQPVPGTGHEVSRLQYRDFTGWQNKQNLDLSEEIKYWKTLLPEKTSRLLFPSSKKDKGSSEQLAGKQEFQIPAADLNRIRRLCADQQATIFTFFMTAFQVLLYRYTMQTEIILGTEIARRQHPDFENLIGVFINIIPVMSDLSEDLPFSQLWRSQHTRFLDLISRKDVPFEILVRELAPKRSAAQIPYIHAFLDYRNYPQAKVDLEELHVKEIRFERRRALFDLALDITENVDEISGLFIFSRELFSEATVRRMSDHYLEIIQSILDRPETSIGELNMLNDEDKSMLEDFQHGRQIQHDSACVHILFEQTARRYPDAIAIVDGQETIRFGELNQRADELAAYLHSLGVGFEDRVAVCLPRSIELITANLAIWKAGAVFVPVDRSSTMDIKATILKDSSPAFILTNSVIAPELNTLEIPSVLMNQKLPANFPGQTYVPCQPDQLAYILYTSGTTGQPKGVAIEHHSLANVIQWYRNEFQINPKEHISQTTRITFDACMREIWGSLVGGACLHIASEQISLDPKRYWDWIASEQISIAYLPTPLADLMLRAPIPANIVLRYLMTSGDKLAALPAQGLSFTLVNLYGPCETTTNCTAAIYRSSTEQCPHIGKPIDNVSIYILDTHQNPVPPGIQGEIYIAGAGVGRGYWQNENLTQEKYFPDPFQPGERMYKSGDWASFLLDGNIEFGGRIDLQVKIRGQRVDLAEIESVLDQIPGIEKSLVRIFETGSREKKIAAFVTGSEPVDEMTLKQSLKNKLPDVMLPHRILLLKHIPYTKNGKYDRQSLPEPDWQTAKNSSAAIPENPTQEVLLGIWKNILSVENIGIDDDFFFLGGHSLLATKLCILIEEQLKKNLSYIEVFNYPTIRQMAAQLETKPLQVSGSSNGSQQDSMIHPIAPIQRGMWFLQTLQPESNAYHINIHLKLIGDLNKTGLQFALDEIIRRHEALRTTFPVVNGEPVQQVKDFSSISMEEFDISAFPENDWNDRVEEIYHSRQSSFKLKQEIPIRFLLIHCAPEIHHLVIIIHHIMFDGTSIDLFIEELTYHYQHYLNKNLPVLPEVPIQYCEYATNYQHWLETEEAHQQQMYWRQVFDTEPPSLELPADHLGNKRAMAIGKSHLLFLSAKLVTALKSLCTHENVTPFMLMLSAYNVLLYRYTGQSDLSIGAPINLRKTREQLKLIGLYINTIALRSDLSGNPVFLDYLQQVRQTCLLAYENRDLPFDQLVEHTKNQRRENRSPLFQVMFQLQRTSHSARTAEGLQFELAHLPYPTAKFDLILNVRDIGEEMICAFNYDAELFQPARIELMAKHFLTLLESMVSEPDQKIDQLSIIPAEEVHQIVRSWNQTKTGYAANQTVPEVFTTIAARQPNSWAVLGTHALSYQELALQSNRIANFLINKGLMPGECVAVFTFSTPEMIACLLGILKAGGSYVPIDPEYPQERIQIMLADSRPRFVFSHSTLASRAKLPGVSTFLLDDDWDILQNESHNTPDVSLTADAPAYVIYTSGSTGTPKGVIVPHRAINRLVLDTDYIAICQQDTIAQASNLSFDAATFEIWGALLNGSRLALISRDTLLSPNRLEQKLKEVEISILFLTTALFNTYAEKHPAVFSHLRCLLFGGEESHPQRVRDLIQNGFSGQLLHMYGPTENTTFSTWYQVIDVPVQMNRIPIGKPIANTTAYILGQDLSVLPPGIPGELYLGGDGLALGYLNQPDFTAERFVDDPFTPGTTAKLYRTGDICEYQADGNIIFLGRADEQIKIRGFRVELGEIRSTFNKHPGISDAVVLLMRDDLGEKFLAAYLTPSTEPVSVEIIRKFLQDLLPDYMVPASIQWLDEIPISPNGKVDRSRLPLPQTTKTISANASADPGHSPTQRIMTEIWEKVLDKERIELEDNFFDLGGHSILIVRLCVEIEEALGVSLTFSQVFERPTIAGLCKLLEQEDFRNEHGDRLETIVSEEQKAFFWIGSGFWQFQKHLHGLNPIRIPEQGEDGHAARLLSVEKLAEYHAKNIKAIQPVGPYHIGGFSFGGMVAFETARQLKDQGEEVDLLLLIEPTLPRHAVTGEQFPGSSKNDKTDAISNLMFKLSRQLDDLAKVHPNQRLQYLGSWVSTQFENRMLVPFIGRISNAFHAKGKIIPLKWRHYYIHDFNVRLAQKFQPQKYPGQFVLVMRKSTVEPSSQHQKAFLPSSTREVIEIIDCPRHEDLMREPYVLEWMGRINQRFR